MKVDDIARRIAGIPHMSTAQGRTMTDIITENEYCDILELGFRHGVSTCYMAGAVAELRRGHITTIDLTSARDARPNIEELLTDLRLSDTVTVFYEPTSYVWRLMRLLEDDPSPRFDLCYIDGAHTWFTDGFAFFLVDRLLRPGGLIIFDDLDWTHESSPALRDSAEVRAMPADERTTPQVRRVYELLVKPHPVYGRFTEKDGWAYAYKSEVQSSTQPTEPRKEIVYERQYVGLGGALLRIARRVRSRT